MHRLFQCIGRRRTTGLMSRSSDAAPDCSCDVAYTMLATPTDVLTSTSEPEEIFSMPLAPATLVAVELSATELKVSDSDAGTTECAEQKAAVAAVDEAAVDVTLEADNAVNTPETAYPKMTSPRCISPVDELTSTVIDETAADAGGDACAEGDAAGAAGTPEIDANDSTVSLGLSDSAVSTFGDRRFHKQERLLQEQLTAISQEIRVSSMKLNGAFKRQRERDALLTKEQRRLSILLKELQQTRHRIERTDRNISAVRLEHHDVKKELMSTSAREVSLIKKQLSEMLPQIQQAFQRFTESGVDGQLEDVYRDIKESEELIVRLQYVIRRRHRKREPVAKEAGEPYNRRLLFNSASPVASRHRKLVLLRKDVDAANATFIRTHALSSVKLPSGGEPRAIGSTLLTLSKLERRPLKFVETEL